MSLSRYDQLDDLLTRIHVARQRAGWRRRLLGSASPITSVSALRVMRAVEHLQDSGGGASVKDVAECIGVEHSTASRTVAGVVASGLLTKDSSADDQRMSVLVMTDLGRDALNAVADRQRQVIAELVADWQDADVDSLVGLLGRLAEQIEKAAWPERLSLRSNRAEHQD